MLKIVGLLVKKIINDYCEGHNCDFTYKKIEDEEYVLMCEDIYHVTGHAVIDEYGKEYHRKYEITLRNGYGECGSGWTTASYGFVDIKPVNNFRPWNYKPKQQIILENISIKEMNSPDFSCEYFRWSYDGGDGYYPTGYVDVNLNCFEELPRNMKKRPVWIFKGYSGLGKTSLAIQLENEDVYDTDISSKLPECITESVVVLGNKHGHTLEDIKTRLFGNPEIILVDFSKEVSNERD